MNIRERFRTAPWLDRSKDESILIGGAGGIGSNVAYSLAKSTLAKILVQDFDVVEVHNIGTQFFLESTIGKGKSESLALTVKNFGVSNIYPLKGKITSQSLITPICIAAFDNITSRKEMFENWKKLPNRELFIDGRLTAELYEVYAVLPGKEDAYEKTLFEEGEGSIAPCTFKQSAYLAIMIGARITQLVINYLINKYSNDDIKTADVPFYVTEVAEIFYIKIE